MILLSKITFLSYTSPMSSQLSDEHKLSDSIIDSLPIPPSQKDYFDGSFKEKGSFGVRISKGGTRTFFLIYRVGKKNKRITIGRYPELNTKEARSKSISLLRRMRLSKSLPVPQKISQQINQQSSILSKSTGELTLSSLAARFIHHSKISGLSGKTLDEYQRLLNKEVLPLIGDFEIKELKKHHFLEIYEDILLHRRKRVLANRVRALLHRMFEFAVEREMRASNPLRNTSRAPEPGSSRDKLTTQDLRKLFFLLQSKNSESASAVLFSLLSGQSLRMVCNSKWDEFIQGYWAIKIHTSKINISNSAINNQGEGTEEDTPSVFLHLNDLARSLLNLKFETKSKSSYVFSSRSGKPLRYIEKSVRQFGEEISCPFPLTARVIRKSVTHALKENIHLLNPTLKDIEIDLFLNPLKSANKNIHTVSINYEVGKRASLLLEMLLLNDPNTNLPHPQNIESNPTEPTPSSKGNVIFIPKDKWKRK